MVAGVLALLAWMAWIRCQYAFGKGGNQTIVSSLDFDGHGDLLEVGCGFERRAAMMMQGNSGMLVGRK